VNNVVFSINQRIDQSVFPSVPTAVSNDFMTINIQLIELSNPLLTQMNERTTYHSYCSALFLENAISFRTFRHWGATMTYYHTKNILLVQKILGHKSIQNTLKYTQLVHFKDDQYDVATAETVEEAKELAGAGFDYFTTINGIQIFRKPKLFQKYMY